MFRFRWRAHFAILLVVLGPAYALNALWVLAYGDLLERWMVALEFGQVGGLDPAALPPIPADAVLTLLVVYLVLGVAGVVATAAVINVLGWTYGGGWTSAGRALRAAVRRAARLIGATLLFGLAVTAIVLLGVFGAAALFAVGGAQGGLAGLIALIVIVGTFAAVLFLLLRWTLVVHVVALEDRGPMAALARSWQLVSGSTWRMLGYVLLLVLVLGLAGLVASVVQTLIFGLGFDPLTGELRPFDPARAVGQVLVQAILTLAFTPFYLAVLTLLYYDLRWRRGEVLQPPPG